MRGIEGNVVLVTGGASGIGAACAERFVAEGAHVVVGDVQRERARQLAESLGERCSHVVLDVTDELSISSAIDHTIDAHGRLDVLFANAGVLGAVGPIATSDTADVDVTFAVNLRGVYLCMKHAARVMVPQRRGCIIATASPGGHLGGVGPHAYSASKAGVAGLTRSVAAELRPHGIRVIALVPGAVVSAMTAQATVGDTDALDRAAAAMGHTGELTGAALPADIAGAVVFAASADAAFMTGAELVIDGGYTHAAGKTPFVSDRYATAGPLLGDGFTTGDGTGGAP